MRDDRNWDRELAKIDRLMSDDQPAADSKVPAKRNEGGTPAEQKAAPKAAPQGKAAGTGKLPRLWLMAVIGPIGAAALFIWPYGTDCGLPLYVYIVGALAVLGASLMTMRAAWQRHHGVAMLIGILTMLVALALMAAVILPRTGYAVVTLPWSCAS